MIPSIAVKQFLERPRDDHRWMKELIHADLDVLLAKLNARPGLGLHLHQKVALALGIAYPRFAFWYDLGTGKTRIALELLQHWWGIGKLRRALVFVKSDKAFLTWERQAREYDITVPFVTLDGSSAKKWDQLDNFGNGIVILHYPGAVAMVANTHEGEWTINEILTKWLGNDVDAIVLDESVKVSNHRSLTYKLIKRLADRSKYLYALSGMPFGRDPTLLWSQMKLIDGGQTLGETLGLFRSAFFSAQKNYWDKTGRSSEYTFKKSMEPVLANILQHRSLTYTAKECIDLPPTVPLYEVVKLPTANQEYYDAAVNDIMEAKGNMRAMEQAFIRMRQLSSGFLGLKDEDTGDKVQIDFEDNPKLERLLDKLEELPEGCKAVVFYEFTHSGRQIWDELKDMRMNPIWLWSGTKNSRAELERFMKDKSCRVAIVQHKVGAYSLDELKIANYMWFYESPVSAMDRVQAEGRLVRQGQKAATVFIGDIVVKGTVDESILGFHKEGKDLFKALLADPGIIFGRV